MSPPKTKVPNASRPYFDKGDTEIFACDDARLRADALKHSIVPKLDRLVNECVALVREVYGVDVLEHSTVVTRPNFRAKRANELGVTYESASAGLRGVVRKGMWKGLERLDERPAQMPPFCLELHLAEDGLRLYLASSWLNGFKPGYFKKVAAMLDSNEVLVRALCDQYFLAPAFFAMSERPYVAPFSTYFELMMKSKSYAFDFESFTLSPPIARDEIAELQLVFLAAYAIYESYAQIALELESQFASLIARLNEWQLSEDGGDALQALERVIAVSKPASSCGESLSAGDLERVRQAAELRTTVMSAKRWQVFLRDGFRCVACGLSRHDGEGVTLQIDHKVPRSKGGSDDFENLQTLCNRCNSGKSNRDSSDVVSVIRGKKKRVVR